jgi:hypothetical protein
MKFMQYEMTYDGQGNITSEIASYWDEDTETWIPWWKDEYTYTDGKLTLLEEFIYYEEGSSWLNSYRTTSTYNPAGKLESEVTEEWDFMLAEWVNQAKWEYTYDGQGRNTEELEYEWDKGSSVWLNSWKYAYTWDQHGNMTEEVDSEWDGAEWVLDWRGVWAFNMTYTILDLFVPYWFLLGNADLTFYHMPVSLTAYYYQAAWIMWWRQMAFYSAFHSSVNLEDIEQNKIKVFPNPASDYLTVTWDEGSPRLNLEIFSLTGKSVLNRSVDKNESVRIEHLSQGLYLYKLTESATVIQTGKISIR